MPIAENSFKHAIKNGQKQIGFWASLASPIVCNVLLESGFDWIVVDAEHAPNDHSNVLAQLQVLNAGPATAVVRPAWNDQIQFKKLLDIGAHSLLVPFVQNADEARQAVRQTRYPPSGVRGVAVSTRANNYGRVADYFATANDAICLLVQLETRGALSELEAICAVDGIDGVFIGPSDLAADLGHLGDAAHPVVQDAIANTVDRCKAMSMPAGILAPVIDDAHRYLEMGFTFVAVGADVGVLRAGADALAQEFARHRSGNG